MHDHGRWRGGGMAARRRRMDPASSIRASASANATGLLAVGRHAPRTLASLRQPPKSHPRSQAPDPETRAGVSRRRRPVIDREHRLEAAIRTTAIAASIAFAL